MIRKALIAASVLAAGSALAEPATYTIDSAHTYPAFEADHMGGMSLWRGKFNSTAGTVKLDRAAKTGEMEITVQMGSVDFGHDKMNEHAMSADMFDVAKFPTATYKGKFSKWNGDVPTEVTGELTMHGVTKPVTAQVVPLGTGTDPWKNVRVGYETKITIKRSDFEMKFMPDGIGDDIELTIGIEGAKK